MKIHIQLLIIMSYLYSKPLVQEFPVVNGSEENFSILLSSWRLRMLILTLFFKRSVHLRRESIKWADCEKKSYIHISITCLTSSTNIYFFPALDTIIPKVSN